MCMLFVYYCYKKQTKFLELRMMIRKRKPLVFLLFSALEFDSCLSTDSLIVLLKVHFLPLTLQGMLSSDGNSRAKTDTKQAADV